jgi:hypothetical protein
MTEPYIWNEIFIDPGIEKEYFLPKLLLYWEDYWNNEERNSKKMEAIMSILLPLRSNLGESSKHYRKTMIVLSTLLFWLMS